MNNETGETEEKPNHLINEKNPYLLQHAYNPVNWYPWGEGAFEKAKNEDKPIFLSIGYSTCHWCHVMEKESFEDPEVARLLNENFVSIKVDREEHPDIDSIYMDVCQALTGRGGWPLTIIMTPDKKPFSAATYLPKESRFGLTGLVDLLPRISDMWSKQKRELVNRAEQIASSIEEFSTKQPEPQELGNQELDTAYKSLLENYDPEYGGFGTAPKFPSPHNLMYLMRYWERTSSNKALEMVEQTLKCMRKGGIFDHIGFGFHRYSTDRYWLVPHFEKMLYDQALLSMAYTEAYQATGKTEYAETAKDVFTYVLRDLTSKEGGFYSALDADSEGVEGKFYTWTYEEIQNSLSKTETNIVTNLFNLKKEGNFIDEKTGKPSGKNIPHLLDTPLYIDAEPDETLDEFHKKLNEAHEKREVWKQNLLKTIYSQKRLEVARRKLFEAREKRVHPAKDDKILTDWNGLMIAALSKGAQVFDDNRYSDAARNAADFILENMYNSSGQLMHRYRDGESAVQGFVDDYAFLTWGLIELYETTFEVKYLKKALELNSYLISHFWDNKNGGFYFTSDTADSPIVRKKEIYDGAIPSGNSVAIMNLLRLGRMTGNLELENKASDAMQTFSKALSWNPLASTHSMQALDFVQGSVNEIVITGDFQSEDTQNMLKSLRSDFIPRKIVLLKPDNVESPEIVNIAGFTRNMSSQDGKATAHICQNYTCSLPTTDVTDMIESLKNI
ncbi:MAG: thioredoxin domain-containing protein [Methanohalobium sp.]|uniref:thioredoxin domain-containing protein n=1 Tax=Methanohalobium sp. TaxID=2837493 RepID=UPI00397ABB93